LQVLALFAGQPYDSELGDLGNLDAHLTNTCRLDGGVEEEQAVRLLSELPQVSHAHTFVECNVYQDHLFMSTSSLAGASKEGPAVRLL